MSPIRGVLEPFSETGTEGICWCVWETGTPLYTGLNLLEAGDYLTIFDPIIKNTVLWEGVIELDYTINLIPIPTNPDHNKQAVDGWWVNGLQTGVDPNVWFAWFVRHCPAELVKNNSVPFPCRSKP